MISARLTPPRDPARSHQSRRFMDDPGRRARAHKIAGKRAPQAVGVCQNRARVGAAQPTFVGPSAALGLTSARTFTVALASGRAALRRRTSTSAVAPVVAWAGERTMSQRLRDSLGASCTSGSGMKALHPSGTGPTSNCAVKGSAPGLRMSMGKEVPRPGRTILSGSGQSAARPGLRLRTRSGIAMASATRTTPATRYSMGKSRLSRPGKERPPPCWSATAPEALAVVTHCAWLVGHETPPGPVHWPVALNERAMSCLASLEATTWNVTVWVVLAARLEMLWSPVFTLQPAVLVAALTTTLRGVTGLVLVMVTVTSPSPPGGRGLGGVTLPNWSGPQGWEGTCAAATGARSSSALSRGRTRIVGARSRGPIKVPLGALGHFREERGAGAFAGPAGALQAEGDRGRGAQGGLGRALEHGPEALLLAGLQLHLVERQVEAPPFGDAHAQEGEALGLAAPVLDAEGVLHALARRDLALQAAGDDGDALLEPPQPDNAHEQRQQREGGEQHGPG